MEFILVAVLLALSLVGLFRPFIGLLSLMIVMELQPGELYPHLASFHLERVVAGTLIAAFLIHGQKLRIEKSTAWFLAFYGSMILSIPLSIWISNSIASCISFLEIVVYVLLAVALLTTENRIRWFLLTFILMIDWLGGSALWNYAHGIWQVRMHIDRAIGITSSAGDPNTMALTLVTCIPLAIALMMRGNPMWMRLVGLVSIAISLVTIVDTGSRGGAFDVVFLVMLLLFWKPKNLIFLPVLIALSPVVWMAIPAQYKARYKTVDNLKDDGSFQNRVKSWEGGIGMFESNPVTGIGTGNYVEANGMRFWPGNGRKVWLDAHSLYFKIIGELGLFGLITFGGYVIVVLRLNRRTRKELIAQNASRFLIFLPGMFSIIYLLLLFAGYASHDLYRSTWFIVGAMAASLSLLPMLQQPVSEISGEAMPVSVENVETQWSPALLPVLRNRVTTDMPV